VIARLEGAREKIQQADFRLGDNIRVETAEIDGKRGARQRSRHGYLACSARAHHHGNPEN
jgi:hypothetical protein